MNTIKRTMSTSLSIGLAASLALVGCDAPPTAEEAASLVGGVDVKSNKGGELPHSLTKNGHTSQNASSRARDDIPDGYVRVPGGMLTHSSCVHEIPSRAHVGADLSVRDERGALLPSFEPCAYAPIFVGERAGKNGQMTGDEIPSTNGWIASTQQYIPAWATTWTLVQSVIQVPDPPNDSSATLYYFSGLVSSNDDQILQPVLQWGSSPAGGGPGWAIASWEVFTNGVAAYTNLKSVRSGDLIFGEIKLVSVTSNACAQELVPYGTITTPLGTFPSPWQTVCGTNYEYSVDAYDLTQAIDTGATFNQIATGPDAPPNGTLFPWAFPAVYESYNDQACENGAQFTGIALYAGDVLPDRPVPYRSIAYAGTLGPTSGRNSRPSCFDGVTSSGNTTRVY